MARYIAGERGFPTPPNIHWTQKVKKIMKDNKISWWDAKDIFMGRSKKTISKVKKVVNKVVQKELSSDEHEERTKMIKLLNEKIKNDKSDPVVKELKKTQDLFDDFILNLKSDRRGQISQKNEKIQTLLRNKIYELKRKITEQIKGEQKLTKKELSSDEKERIKNMIRDGKEDAEMQIAHLKKNGNKGIAEIVNRYRIGLSRNIDSDRPMKYFYETALSMLEKYVKK